LEWKHPPQQQKKKQQENTNLHAPHAVCIHSCSVKTNKLRKGYFHDTNYGRKEPNWPQIINMELGTLVCISTKEKKERGFSVVVVHTTMVTRWPSSSKRNAACDPM
jgi:hypothetical protein